MFRKGLAGRDQSPRPISLPETSDVPIHANRLAGIAQTILCIVRPKRHAPEARARLAAFAEEYSRRDADLARLAERLRADRDQAIRQAYKDGLPMADIARVLGMSHQRISQIVRS